VVGRGAHGEEKLLVTASREEGFRDSLVMAGWVEPAELADYLAAGDVAIYPFDDTLVNRAKCPAKLTELLRAAIPVVADNIGQVNEYIKPGVSGILCNPGDYQNMAHQVAMLLEDPDKRRQLGNMGRKYLFDHFSWPQFACNLERFYMTKGIIHE
jgi:glycosyltransferase involved in cell wall biosynthesis